MHEQVVDVEFDRIGGRLFERTSHTTRLTPLGEQLVRDLAPARAQVDRALASAHDTATGVAGTLRLGVYMPINGGPHLVEIIKTFEAQHPDCRVTLIDTGFERDQLDWLRANDADLLAARLPLPGEDLTVDPILSSEERIVAVSLEHPLAHHDAASFEELAEYPVADIPTLPREMIDAFIPPRTPSGTPLRRIATSSPAHVLVRVALGELIHPTVLTFLEQYRRPGVTSVPISDLPPSQTALVWPHTETPKILAFAQTAASVLARKQRQAAWRHQHHGRRSSMQRWRGHNARRGAARSVSGWRAVCAVAEADPMRLPTNPASATPSS